MWLCCVVLRCVEYLHYSLLFFSRNIKRVVFDSLTKFDGEKLIPVPEQQIRQIAGRAGRFGTAHEVGLVTCRRAKDFALLESALNNPHPVPYMQAYIGPSFECIERIQDAFPRFSLGDVLDAFFAFAQLPGHYRLAELFTVRKLLQLLQGFDFRTLDLEDLFTFLSAPVKVESETVASAFLSVRPVCVYSLLIVAFRLRSTPVTSLKDFPVRWVFTCRSCPAREICSLKRKKRTKRSRCICG